MCSKNFENQLTNKSLCAKVFFNRDFSVEKLYGREITFFPENLKSLNKFSKMLGLYITSRKAYLSLKLLNQANILAETQSV